MTNDLGDLSPGSFGLLTTVAPDKTHVFLSWTESTLRDVERASLEIRSLEGVISATTSITLDETNQTVVSKKMAKFLRDPEFGKQLSQFIVAQKEP